MGGGDFFNYLSLCNTSCSASFHPYARKNPPRQFFPKFFHFLPQFVLLVFFSFTNQPLNFICEQLFRKKTQFFES